MTLQEEQELRTLLEGRGDPSTFDTSYIVEAGAGAGKSTTMVRRITNLLLSGKCRSEQLVAITFTVKATQELKNKLENNFRSLLEAHPNEPKYRELADSVDLMQISTIDSFCQKLLTTMPFSNCFGMSGVMETDDKGRGSAFFRRRCREDDSIAQLAERFALSYDALEQTFLAACGRGDYQLSYTPPGESAIRDIEQKKLPAAARKARDELAALSQKYPHFAAMVSPELYAISMLPDSEYNPGGQAVEGLLRFVRTRRKANDHYNVLNEEPLSPFTGKVNALWNGLSACLPKAYKKCELTLDAAEKCRKSLNDILTSDNAYLSIVDPELVKLLGKYNDDTFVSDPASLIEFNDFIYARQNKKGEPCKESWILPVFRSDVEAALGLDGKTVESVDALSIRLMHSYALDAVNALLADYDAEKRAANVATFGDALVMARDILRDDARARAYFRDRYRFFYVDEFQDTDAVQTELLFYLATPEKDFHAGNWNECRPRPGSLFLVGDPKQAIYRFRGADIDTYSAVWNLFEEAGIGETAQLSFNFRSTKEICDLSCKAFDNLMDGKACQAAFAPMTAVQIGAGGIVRERNADPLSLTLCYQPDGGDSERIAAFVQTMVDRGVTISARDDERPTRYEDFLILTYRRKEAEAYAAALHARQIPVSISGEEKFSETIPIARAVVLLKYLVNREDTLRLIVLLKRCCAVELSTVRRLMQRGGLKRLTDVFQTEDSDGARRRKLDGIAEALAAETKRDNELLALCAALAEIDDFAALVGTLPAMSVMERMFTSLGFLWSKEADQRARREDRARIEQFMEKLRAGRTGNFTALAQNAIELADTSVESELALETERNCVRVMNLHKAKGLEGEIVILAEHKGPFSFKPMSHREQTSNGERLLHLCLTKPTQYGVQPVAWEDGWADKQQKETAYLNAEHIRLLYVAATRAKSMLLVNQCRLWEPIWMRIGDSKKSLQTVFDMAIAARTDAERDRVDALCTIYTSDPFPWTLMGVQRTPRQTPAAQSAAPVRVSPEQMETALRGRVQALAESDRYAITPSRLDRSARTTRLKKDRAEAENNAAETPAKAETDEAPAAERASVPHGPDWGTIVHRVMELAVRNGRYAQSDIAAFARQATSETLGDTQLSKAQCRMLGGETDMDDAALLAIVANAAADAAGFVTRADSELRTLTDGAVCYPELPFQICASDWASDVYRHLTAHISDEHARGKTLEAQGVIDLAVQKDGAWTIVDYKTDIQKPGESDGQFRARLAAEYTPQIAAYAKVMEQFSKERVNKMYLCSIALGGALIELAAN